MDTGDAKAPCKKDSDKIKKECSPEEDDKDKPNKPKNRSSIKKLLGSKYKKFDKLLKRGGVDNQTWMKDNCDLLWIKPGGEGQGHEEFLKGLDDLEGALNEAAQAALDEVKGKLGNKSLDMAKDKGVKYGVRAGTKWGVAAAGAAVGGVGAVVTEGVATIWNVGDALWTIGESAFEGYDLYKELEAIKQQAQDFKNIAGELQRMKDNVRSDPQKGDEKRFDALWAEIEDAPEALDGLWSACGWLSWPVVAPWAQAWSRAEDARLRWLAVGAYSQHRQPLGECTDALAVDGHPRVRAEALLHAGLIGDVSAQSMLAATWHDTAVPLECRVAAACAGALLGDIQGAFVLADAIRLDCASPLSLSIQALCLPDAELDALIRNPSSSELVRLALIRDSGAVRWLPEVINIARETQYAETAGNVFIYLTGADQDELAVAEVEASDNDPEDSDRGDSWIPDPDKLAVWWSAHRAGFVFKRAIGGVSSTPDLWSELLMSGGQQARQHAAWALGLSRPGNGVVNVFAPADRQREWLSAAVE
ncbi:hypothetical protein D9T17_06705 [Lysobacter enzymogenes]|uniref:Uncharacterized protein n=2 Tax=Lysobacter enzymogenes TaxID=69 RepID=A0A3N2RKM8_LYSEN|nr:hypothetical protein D9T17_06705 [Lysobacter enzymogenes]